MENQRCIANKIFGGGWIVMQFRFDGSLDFNRGWDEFRDGFGDLNKEFWLGLEKVHQITSGRKHELMIELKDFNGTYKYARYDGFEIDENAVNDNPPCQTESISVTCWSNTKNELINAPDRAPAAELLQRTFSEQISHGLRNVRVTVPTAIRRGDTAHLYCDYELEDKERLYSIKWYKGKREFYRYTPQETPSMKVFNNVNGVDVEWSSGRAEDRILDRFDRFAPGSPKFRGTLRQRKNGRMPKICATNCLALSNKSNVVIKAVETNISGKYSCEVSADAPSFHTSIVSGDMEVVEPPPGKPSISGLLNRYQLGDILRGNCTAINSKPAANLTWTINDVPVRFMSAPD
ncbi:hypothetical protein AND_003581 [Anopheles darlingi]|uniref:Ig-like domain-containing protein n=1 Tax=Anopheles darlingi TaxID=43151 RepID=W5JMX4_ANODA|nr:hypothetical protein AND_003581 [Anopheles darlingi]